MDNSKFISENNLYYEQLIKNNEELDSLSVGWRQEKQEILFDQFLHLFKNATSFSINDIGCGNGSLFSFLNKRKYKFEYFGFDLSPSFINICNTHYNFNNCHFKCTGDKKQIPISDFSVASGLLNKHFGYNEIEWKKRGFELINTLNETSEVGFAFNALSDVCPLNKRKEGLFFWNGAELYKYCLHNISEKVILLHHYYDYDFTIIVYK